MTFNDRAVPLCDNDDGDDGDTAQFLVKAMTSNYDGEHTRRNALFVDL